MRPSYMPQGKIKNTWRVMVMVGVVAFITMLPISAGGVLFFQSDLEASKRDRVIKANGGEGADGNWYTRETAWMVKPPFTNIIERHNAFLPELARWRRLLARHAVELVELIKTFPGSEALQEDHLRRIFANPLGYSEGLVETEVFAPWTGHWSGVWSNGSPQYHLWDTTRWVNGQWVQPVIQSETNYVGLDHLQERLSRHQVDVGINVFSAENGLTGWVSKYQHGRQEVPHVGYPITDTILVWICQIKSPDQRASADNEWFVFLESVDNSVYPAEYRIYGQPVVIGKRLWRNTDQKDRHFGTYYAEDGEPLHQNLLGLKQPM